MRLTAVFATLSLLAAPALAAESLPSSKLSHIHGLAFDRADPSRLLIATHHGLWRLEPDGMAAPVSETRDDFMGFTPHPTQSTILFASGHPAKGGNLGFQVSTDGGVSWTKVADGVDGPVDFHAMDVSKADPNVVYGLHGGIQVSRDGGKTWTVAGPAPAGTLDLAAGAKSPDIVYAATQTGLLVSKDAGRSWQPAHILKRPVSTVDIDADGTVRAYMLGTGLIAAPEGSAGWATLGQVPGDDFLLHFTAGPQGRFAATSRSGAIVVSGDGGKTWAAVAK
ncbi:MAG TPA: hypothetical protein VEB64_04765 [Azospirillaceae bacterium]|nr:hypothetical protein [Azospirillaceae bacterium]